MTILPSLHQENSINKILEKSISPLPPLEIQQKIVKEIEVIEKAEKNVEGLEALMMKYLVL